MANRSDTTLFLGNGVILPLRSALSWKEDWSQVGDVQFRDTWGGETHVLAPLHKPKYNLTLSASGGGVWRTPNLGALHPGMTITMHSAKWLTGLIEAGAPWTILDRLPVPGSVKVVSPNEDLRPAFVETGRFISIVGPAPASGYAVLFRPVLTMRVGRITMDADGGGGPAGWSVELREKSAPQ